MESKQHNFLSRIFRPVGAKLDPLANIKQFEDLGAIGVKTAEQENAEQSTNTRAKDAKARAKDAKARAKDAQSDRDPSLRKLSICLTDKPG